MFHASENVHVSHADISGLAERARLRPSGFGAAAFARFAAGLEYGLPSRSSRSERAVTLSEPAFALWASARQPSLASPQARSMACQAVAREASEGWWGR